MDVEADRQAQEHEMEILMEILDADCITKYEGTTISGQLKIKVRIPGDVLKCEFAAGTNDKENLNDGGAPGPSESSKKNVNSFELEHLPPLTLHFTLPSDYPSNSKPIFTLSSNWLLRDSVCTLSFFCNKLDELWEENRGMAILFTWHSFLKEDGLASIGFTSETVYDLTPLLLPSSGQSRQPFVPINASMGEGKDKELESTDKPKKAKTSSSDEPQPGGSSGRVKTRGLNGSRIRSKRNPHEVSQGRLDARAVFERISKNLVQYLLDYEKEEKEAEFLRKTHSCAICFSEKRGTDCMLFQCQHIFCKECLRDFFSLHITEGSLECVKCPDLECKTVPTPYEVKALVGAKMFERYDTLLLSKTLDSMSDILSCPRVSCGRPVMYEPDDKLAKCASCGYAFCSICKMVYHGVEPCRFKSAETKELYEKYTTGSSEDRKQLEKMYGKQQMKLLVQQTLSENWVDTQAKPCPHCKVPIEKFEGCNKVTCFKCATYFCWICSLQLDKRNPYFHFNDPSSPCYNKLFTNVDGHEQEGDEGDVWNDAGGGGDDDDDDEEYEFDSTDSDEQAPDMNVWLALADRLQFG